MNAAIQPVPGAPQAESDSCQPQAPADRSARRSPRPALPSLTGVRFAAAFYVVVSHSRVWFERHATVPTAIHNFLSNGSLAVCFFFVLSGFILSYTYSNPFQGLRSYAKFWEARFARIYPVYLLSLLLLLPFQIHLDSRTALSVLLMLQAWNPRHPELTGAWNYPAWSLSVEALFYLCFPFLQTWLSRASRRTLWLAGAALLALAVLAHTPYHSLGVWYPQAYGTILVPLPLVRLPEFIVGMVAGNFFVRYGKGRRQTLLSAGAAIAATIVLASTTGPWVSLVFPCFFVFVYCMASSDDWIASFFRTPAMVLLGGASYAVYLLQLPVREWVRLTLAPTLGALHIPDGPLTPLILVLFSILIFRFWEEPLRRIIRRSLASIL